MIQERWREYIEKFYTRDEKPIFIPLEPEEEVDIDRIGSELLRNEVIKAIQQLENGKSEGSDGILAEM